MDADDLPPPDLKQTAISWWQTAVAALVVGFLAMLAATASHRWTPALVIVLVSAAMLATTLGIGGLVRWRARESEGSQTARELSLSSLTGIAIGMAVLTVAVILAL